MNDVVVEQAFEMIKSWWMADTGFDIEEPEAKTLKEALAKDFANGSPNMDDRDAELLVCGNDDGDIPETVIDHWPFTHSALEEMF